MRPKKIQWVVYLLICLMLTSITACEGNEMFDKELYKKVIYVLSGDDLTYGVAHSLNTPTSIGYISIYAGGTKPVDHDIAVTLERDNELLDSYNYSNYDLDESKYAKELDPSRYKIDNYTAVLKANAQDPYVKLPVEIKPEGLSPDTTYLIPLKIVDNSSFEINQDKSRVLYRVFIANDFTSQENPTVVFMRGTQLGEGETGTGKQMSANKTLYPLTSRTVRINAALENSANRLTEELINKSSLVMEIKEQTATDINGQAYNPIVLSPYNSEYIQVEQTAITDDEEGITLSIQESSKYIVDSDATRYYLSYRYRTLKTEATQESEAVWNEWEYVYENMKVLTN